MVLQHNDEFKVLASSEDARVQAILEAARTVEERGKTYGPPSQHFGRTTGAINAIFANKLREPLTTEDWAMFMIIDKLAREQEVPKHDNAIDMIGYASCMVECKAARSEEEIER